MTDERERRIGPIPQIEREPSSGRPVLLAPGRRLRPKLTAGDPSATACPFCPGAEAQTEPETDAVRAPETAANTPGWRVRSFANKYPAAEHHEVIAEGAEHRERPAALGADRWVEIVGVWQRRLLALEARPGVACGFLFKNVGARAGASIVHSHSQVIGLPELPPRLRAEQAAAHEAGACPWCDALASAEGDGRLLIRDAGLAVIVPPVPRLSYETWLLPLACEAKFEAADPATLGPVLHRWFALVDRALAEPAFNLWLHRIPPGLGSAIHWHLELQPRYGSLAGLELGAELTINSVPASESATRLRAGL